MNLLKQNRFYPFVSAFYALHLTEFCMDPHAHKSLEIMYVTKGRCTVITENTPVQLSQHEFIFLDSHIRHQLVVSPDQPCSMLNLEFFCQEKENGQDMRQLADHCPSFVQLVKCTRPYLTGTDSRNLGYALKDFINQLSQKREPESSYLLGLLFFRMMVELSQCLFSSESSAGLTYLKRACAYITDHLTEDLRIKEISAYAGVNKSYLQSLFRSRLHTTITDYVNQRRLEHAVFLLSNSSMSVTDIGFSSGYNSRQHFGHTFEKFYGCSPKTYRQLNRTALDPSTGNGQYIFQEDGSVKAEPLTSRMTPFQFKPKP